MKAYVIVRTQFEGIHQWDTCNLQKVNFLKNPHRHIFKVETILPVSHNDRQLEFFMLKDRIDKTLLELYPKHSTFAKLQIVSSRSCEMVAQEILTKLKDLEPISVSVFEDDENGAIVVNE